MSATWKWAGSRAALIGLLLVVGCGGDDSESTEGNSSKPAESGTEGEPSPGAGAEPDRPPRVVIETNLGDITVELNEEGTEITTENFLKYVDTGYYDGAVFHKIWAGYVIQGGSYDRNYNEKPPGDYVTALLRDPTIINEAPSGLSNVRGTIAMARDPAVINSSVTKFFFNLSDNSLTLDHQEQDTANVSPMDFGYCAFGTVDPAGMEVLDRIGAEPVDEADRPVTLVEIKSITRVD